MKDEISYKCSNLHLDCLDHFFFWKICAIYRKTESYSIVFCRMFYQALLLITILVFSDDVHVVVMIINDCQNWTKYTVFGVLHSELHRTDVQHAKSWAVCDLNAWPTDVFLQKLTLHLQRIYVGICRATNCANNPIWTVNQCICI